MVCMSNYYLHVLFILYYYVGSEFYIGFIPNFGIPPLIVMLTNRKGLTTYSVEAPVTEFYQNGSIIVNFQSVVNLPNSLSGPSYNLNPSRNNQYKEGVYLQTSSNKITVIGSNQLSLNFDTFFAIPTVDLCLYEYTYYAVSVSTARLSDGSVVIVGTASQTMVNITVPVPAAIKINNSADWTSLDNNTLYSYEIQRLQIVYIAVYGTDLTGTKVTTNKPISLFSGHECAFLPSKLSTTGNCNNLAEQIPPTELWGTVHYFAPLKSRTSYTIKIIAAYNSTTINFECNNITIGSTASFNINAGESITESFEYQEFCRVSANNKVLVSQFSQGDPMMVLIPAIDHYTSSITSSTFERALPGSYRHYVNIIVLASYYQPDMMSFTAGGINLDMPLDLLDWVPISNGDIIEAYAAQVNLTHGVFQLTHFNKSALMTVIVYGFEVSNLTRSTGGYGHPGWLMDQFNNGMYVRTYV